MQSMESNIYTEVQISVTWGHISGRWYGNQMERPILALHGWLDSCGTFAKLAPLIATQRSILCIDLPGHGHSSHLPPGILYHENEFIRVILRIMYSYKWESVSLLGHSMGGSICFHFAALYPDRVDMLISLDAIKHAYIEPDTFQTALRYTIEKALIDNERLQQENPSEPPSYTFAECEQRMYEGAGKSVDLKNCKYIFERNIKKSDLYPNKYYFSRDGRMKYILQINFDMDLSREMVKRICDKCMPYLLIKGGKSRNLSAASTVLDEYLLQNNRNFECHIYPMGTHHLHLNNPKPVAKIILKFLNKFPMRNTNFEISKL